MIDSLGERIDKKFDRFQLTHKLDIELKGILRDILYKNFNPVRNFKNNYISGIVRNVYRKVEI
jgi:hypothetical protein